MRPVPEGDLIAQRDRCGEEALMHSTRLRFAPAGVAATTRLAHEALAAPSGRQRDGAKRRRDGHVREGRAQGCVSQTMSHEPTTGSDAVLRGVTGAGVVAADQ